MMGLAPWTAAGIERARNGTTDLDRYVRSEFRDPNAAWLFSREERHGEEAGCESEDDRRLLRRLVQAIAAFM